MQRFFKDYDSINQFSLSLDFHQDKVKCSFCLKNDQLISHGNVYKQRSMSVKEKVGKRIFCSNRYGRSGCGRTFQLYIATEVPFFSCQLCDRKDCPGRKAAYDPKLEAQFNEH